MNVMSQKDVFILVHNAFLFFFFFFFIIFLQILFLLCYISFQRL